MTIISVVDSISCIYCR